MSITLVLVLLAVAAGIFLAIRSKEYRSGSFWLLIALVTAMILPMVWSG